MLSREEVKTVVRQTLELLQKERIVFENTQLIREKLDRIEELLSRCLSENSSSDIRPNHTLSLHPSQERFCLESLAEKSHTKNICPFEPTAKLCDQCAMCSCRGF